MQWLLLRGMAREQRHWGPFPEILATRVAGARPVCLDLPGTGTERARPSPLSIRAIVEDLRRRWAPEPGARGILGVSLGGMIALDWCAAYPEDFRRAVIVNSSAADLSRPWERLRWQMLPRAMSTVIAGEVGRERTILGMTTHLLPDREAIARRWAMLAADRPMPRTTSLRQAAAAATFRAPRRVRAEVLIVGCERDRLTHPSCSQRLSRALAATFVVHPTAGHDLPLDDPRWLADRVGEWLGAGHKGEQLGSL